MSWLDVFGGNTVHQTVVSLREYDITGTLTLDWPREATAGDTLADLVILSGNGGTVVMPEASAGSLGPAALIYNIGTDDYIVTKNDAVEIATLAPGVAYLVVLRDNSDSAGTWLAFEFGAASSLVQAASLGSPTIVSRGGLLVQAMPVSSISSDYILGELERAQLINWVGGVGILTLTSASTLGNGWFCHVRNSGDGTLTVDSPGSEEIDNTSAVQLNPNESMIVATDGANFFTVRGDADGGSEAFSYISIDVNGAGDYVLSAAEQGFSAYRLTGGLSAARNIIVPTTLGRFILRNETTGLFTLTVKTAAGTGVTVGTDESKYLYCDGTNVRDAATAGISTPVQVSEGGTGATSASAARNNLGLTSIGNAIATAANDTAVRSAAGASTIGDAVFVATTTAIALTALGMSTIGKALAVASSAANARNTLVLGNVNNTADLDKPVSTAQTAAINAAVANRVSKTGDTLEGLLTIKGAGTAQGVLALNGYGTIGGVNYGSTITFNDFSYGGPVLIRPFHQPGVVAGLQISLNGIDRWEFINGGAALKAVAGSWSALSDARIKRNVTPYLSGLEQILALDPVHYSFRHDSGYDPGPVHIGLIAQAAELAMPELVSIAPGVAGAIECEDMRTLDPTALTYALINAVKALHARVVELESR